ncbi:23S rRNA pseudouridine(1911/1915/1917) synthase RluD [Psychrosphaera sp. F3M07]|uniref:23S rRNA pseudouridine(1911/1915/1917) synthase RluD n=1 Tax=Psychrosphaera sp. F3M07 TaxID=2841560 RepID=UPI001C0976F6|nr:23S rRNA pseudouridine(1911/1915/1917) synthase RluD [Psychrosphaera sp. F3M07]MBU2917426.1 23S rRNA pseudouridine(1911/1915/1917) synthase RluD [Psychrosphaera sp. F3M07]
MTKQTIELQAQVNEEQFGKRLDQVIAELFPEYSRSRLKEWILAEKVQVDGEIISKPRLKMNGDEEIVIHAELDIEVHHQPEDIKLEIIYEDDDILVINKPTDLVVHPGAGNQSGTILNALLYHFPEIDKVPRAGIVHRLDKDTTGLMVVAKTVPAQTQLVADLQARQVTREYEAVCLGRLTAGGTVDKPIGRHPTKRTNMAVNAFGRESVTHYRLIKKFREHTHIRLRLETGRTHQIRVHMSYIKHPLVGDVQYGGRVRTPKGASEELLATMRGFKRQALHAAMLRFHHPVTEEEMTFEAPLPDDFVNLLAALNQDLEDHKDDMDYC